MIQSSAFERGDLVSGLGSSWSFIRSFTHSIIHSVPAKMISKSKSVNNQTA